MKTKIFVRYSDALEAVWEKFKDLPLGSVVETQYRITPVRTDRCSRGTYIVEWTTNGKHWHDLTHGKPSYTEHLERRDNVL